MLRTKWVDRKFTFDFPEGWLPDIMERLRGTEARLRSMLTGLGEEELCLKPGGKWSIKEHVGHLGDLEELHLGRLDDFAAFKDELRAADMSNAKTEAANHNARNLEELIAAFSKQRIILINRFDKLSDEIQVFRSMHPRLKTMMRPVDVAFFSAEHDDHHLASIRAILRMT